MMDTHWPIAKEGLPFLIISALVSGVFALLGWTGLAVFGLLVTLFIAFFFRNPERTIPAMPDVILAPADGKVIVAEVCDDSRFQKGKALKISIFMSVFNVHINRAPVTGRVIDSRYNPGKFHVASVDKASLLNEQNALLLVTENRGKVGVVQIAGLVARRIICYAKRGDSLKQGQVFGLIRFGSRVDLYLPPEVRAAVSPGQHVKGGESIVGYWV
jgi:phosphatidylserine decarboxylase